MVDEKKELITLDKETYSRIMKENEIAKKILDCICNKRYFIYKHTNPEGKIYIGITQKLPYDRWKNGGGYKGQKRLYEAILKDPWEKWEHEILDCNLTREEAIKMENDYILFYKSYMKEYGFNTTVNKPKSLLINEDVFDKWQKYLIKNEERIKKELYSWYKDFLMIIKPTFDVKSYLCMNMPNSKYKLFLEERYEAMLDDIKKEHKDEILSLRLEKKEYLSLLNQYLKSYEKYIYCNQIGMLLFDEEKYCRNELPLLFLNLIKEKKQWYVKEIIKYIVENNAYHKDICLKCPGLDIEEIPNLTVPFVEVRLPTRCTDFNGFYIVPYDSSKKYFRTKNYKLFDLLNYEYETLHLKIDNENLCNAIYELIFDEENSDFHNDAL